MPAPHRALATVVALALVLAGCGDPGRAQGPLADGQPSLPGQAPGTVVLTGTGDAGQVVQRLQDAVTANSGTVATVVDHTAQARAAGVELAASTLVIGGPPAAQVPLLLADQRAGANLPQRYLVRQEPGGPVTVTYNGATYIAAVSGVTDAAARTALRDTSAAVAAQATGDASDQISAPLIGVTPADFLLTVFGSADVPATVARLRRAADAGPSRVAASIDMAAGSDRFGPAIRPTSVVFVSNAEAEAPLLRAAPTMGLELPMPYVVWVDDQARTQIGHPDIRKLAQRHGIAPTDPAVTRILADSERLARIAAGLQQQ
ncbi:DUF302 domain-containing protein [Pseudonocardia acidicola]|uniref:DUF302 domain-containing protein n=1 Tax=Pseudonocardia acidicola TaxID=2724939 RepID=A0ABX1SGP8_9PSEU|nr:DUF302 domain-containing protein [Pseudonocardia acidicola]NMI00737.1 DUF302 domain-containing protein [Pseudonocardia acidicola]